MRSALLFVLFALAIQRHETRPQVDTGFRPTAIPLSEFSSEDQGGRAAEGASTAQPAPAHYWEDALRHSVYLTLVRDKIDQLIAKGEVIAPNTKPDAPLPKEVDDHDLWDKIKSAPFVRIPEKEEDPNPGDVTLMAKGKLMEDKNGYRFVEVEKNEPKCNDNDTECSEGIKALWSVKRLRSRESETIPGKYHYELTFSVITQAPKKQRKPYENPTRTFTVRETSPETILDDPLEHRYHEHLPQASKGQRTIWVHKNITPVRYHSRQYQNGFDRLFSSLFDDDDERPRPKPSQSYGPPPYTKYSKVGYVNSPSESHQHKKLVPYPYKPHTIKYSRPLPPPPPIVTPHYLDMDSIGVVSNHYMPPYTDNRYGPPAHPHKNGRPPTYVPSAPLSGDTNSTNATVEQEKAETVNITSTGVPDIITGYHKSRPPMKVNYFSDHIRPPVFNAPPGIFVTMEKKPFKPMPPLRPHSKPLKPLRPLDFRPSPQLIDTMQFSEPDPLTENAFRPINIKYTDSNVTEASSEVAESSKQKDNVVPKLNTTENKPTKKFENKKAHVQTYLTTTPDIITAQSVYEDAMPWANLLGAFSKTTPMGTPSEKSKESETTTPLSTSSTLAATTRHSTTTEALVTTTAAAPKKRTRPPPKFENPKPVKVKKHKRVTTTTTTTTSTEPPARSSSKPANDLTPQASSSPNKPIKKWTPSSTLAPSTYKPSEPASTTTRKPSTTQATTSTTESYSVITSFTAEYSKPTEKPKNKNRYRQSTLMTKGTSVNHDKWSPSNTVEYVSKTRTVLPPTGNFPKRKGSNFQGYVTAPTFHASNDQVSSSSKNVSSKKKEDTTSSSTKVEPYVPKPTQPTYYDENEYDSLNKYINEAQTSQHDDSEEYGDFEDEEKHNDKPTDENDKTTVPNDTNNEIALEDMNLTTEQTYAVAKNKTKCKKKKTNKSEDTILNTELEEEQLLTTLTPTSTTESESPTTKDIFDDLFGGFTLDDTSVKPVKDETPIDKVDLENEASENHEQRVQVDDEYEDFLDEVEKQVKAENAAANESDSEREARFDEKSFSSDEEEISLGGSPSYDDLEENTPISLLELMGMA